MQYAWSAILIMKMLVLPLTSVIKGKMMLEQEAESEDEKIANISIMLSQMSLSYSFPFWPEDIGKLELQSL
ncbi:hypothetical protein EUGRSUZ_D00198 [Eucalyptus grandis]|uniref:Uncharacterized protein n=2 Tax=Eucalyptus grandis TaxID=71139 RepID=A0ACC3L2E7_EUCGR|nr:hypothetical protein EUGRSUZ_D00198 [Eucalyptus grandis]